jgi:hypothetical protein
VNVADLVDETTTTLTPQVVFVDEYATEFVPAPPAPGAAATPDVVLSPGPQTVVPTQAPVPQPTAPPAATAAPQPRLGDYDDDDGFDDYSDDDHEDEEDEVDDHEEDHEEEDEHDDD